MCGILGVINGRKSRNARASICNFIKDGIVAGSVRGLDSTGVMQVDKKGTYMQKDISSGSDFVRLKEVGPFYNDADTSFATVVHHRAATSGAITLQNAHPFYHEHTDGNVLGVHNGSLINWTKVPGSDKFNVDSSWAMNMLGKHKEKAFEYFNGAYCFVWHDTATKGWLNMARNKERPMHFAYVKDGSCMVFASEPGMLHWLCSRNGIALKDDLIYELEEDMLYSFNLNNPKEFTKTKLPSIIYTHFKDETAAVNFTGVRTPIATGMRSAWGSSQDDWLRGLSDALKTEAEKQEETKVEEPLDTGEEIKRAWDGVYTEEEEQAKLLELLGVEVTVELETYDWATKTVYCSYMYPVREFTEHVIWDSEIGDVIIRDVDKKTYEALSMRTTHDVRVLGAYDDENRIGLIVTSTLIDASKKANAAI